MNIKVNSQGQCYISKGQEGDNMMYVLSEYGGDYDDSWEMIVGVFDTAEQADYHKEKREAKMKLAQSTWQDQEDIYRAELEKYWDTDSVDEAEYARIRKLAPDWQIMDWTGMKIQVFPLNVFTVVDE